MRVGNCMRDVNVALIAITPSETPPRLQRIFYKRAAIKLLTFIASCYARKILQLDVWQLALSHFGPKLFTVDYPKCVLLKLHSWDQSRDTIKRAIYHSR